MIEQGAIRKVGLGSIEDTTDNGGSMEGEHIGMQ